MIIITSTAITMNSRNRYCDGIVDLAVRKLIKDILRWRHVIITNDAIKSKRMHLKKFTETI